MATAIDRDSKTAGGREIKDTDFKPGPHFFTETENRTASGGLVAAPKYVWGIVDPRTTTGRDSPPDISIFPTADSFFDIGHIMALELGGADAQQNLMPQYRFQNQHGPWKAMETALRKKASDNWGLKSYTFVKFELKYPTSGLVPDSITVTTASIKQALFPSNPELVENWRTTPPPGLESVTATVIDNKLMDRDMEMTGMSKLTAQDDKNWKSFQLGRVMSKIETSGASEEKRGVATHATLVKFFDTSGRKLNKKQLDSVEQAKATYASATDRSLVSPSKRKSLLELEDYEKKARTEPPGSGTFGGSLDEYRKRFGKGGSEPVARRMSSAPSSPAREAFEDLEAFADEQLT